MQRINEIVKAQGGPLRLASRVYHAVGPVNVLFGAMLTVHLFIYWRANRRTDKWYNNSFFQTYKNTNSIFETRK